MRNTYSTAARVTGSGALKLLGCCALVPVKSMVAARRCVVDANRDAHHRAVVHLVAELAVLEHVDDLAHRCLGVVLHVLHVRVHDRQAVVLGHRRQLRDAFLAGGDLRAQVGEVLRRRCAPDSGRDVSSARSSASRNTPRSTSCTLSSSTPSSSMVFESDGIEPGVMPPMSA